MRPVLLAAGWKPRAAGWFTKPMRPGLTAVIAVSAASKRHAAGNASVTIMVGLRDDATEEIVEQVTGPCTPKYQGRTWVTPLGHLLPNRGYRDGEREFGESDGTRQADELAHLLAAHADPQLNRIADDPSELRAFVENSTSNMGPSGLCRVATLLARTRGPEAAAEYVAQRLSSLGDRADSAADLEREVAPRVLALLGSR